MNNNNNKGMEEAMAAIERENMKVIMIWIMKNFGAVALEDVYDTAYEAYEQLVGELEGTYFLNEAGDLCRRFANTEYIDSLLEK